MDIAKYYSDRLSTHLVRTFNPTVKTEDDAQASKNGSRANHSRVAKMSYMPSGSISIGSRQNLNISTMSINKSGWHVKKLFK